jgi:hypothetical protein
MKIIGARGRLSLAEQKAELVEQTRLGAATAVTQTYDQRT